MENENKEQLIDYEDENAFGPHIKEVNEYGHMRKLYFFTLSYKEQDVSRNKIFIQWKKDMKKINDLVIHCPKCSAYFPNAAYTNCRCDKCGFFFCFGCNKNGCKSTNCLKWWKIIIPFFGLKEYGDANILIKILMYIFMAIQVLFTFPLQVLYKNGPMFAGEDGYTSYEALVKFRRKGRLYCFLMLPYQIAFIGFWFDLTFFFFFLPGIIYPPYSVYWMGIFLYVQRHFHGGTLYEGNGEYSPADY